MNRYSYYILGCILLVLLGSLFGILTGGPTLILLAILLIIIAILDRVVPIYIAKEWLKTVSNCQYSYAYDEYGVAVDTVNRTVVMCQLIDGKPITKTYPFSQIRDWGYRIPSVEPIYQTGYSDSLAMSSIARANAQKVKYSKDNTGFTVSVKDIDYPKWFIKFKSTKTVSMDLSRWMEIFTQHINEGA